MTLKATWIDRGMEPRAQPNPDYPNGIDVDISNGREPHCRTALPYPAKRIGYYYVACDTCGAVATITTAGRVDDPRSIKMACKGGKR